MEKAYVKVEEDEDGFIIELIVDDYVKEVRHTHSVKIKNSYVRIFQIEANKIKK